jgi:hypothetical protein
MLAEFACVIFLATRAVGCGFETAVARASSSELLFQVLFLVLFHYMAVFKFGSQSRPALLDYANDA